MEKSVEAHQLILMHEKSVVALNTLFAGVEISAAARAILREDGIRA
jgi:hypothetical protein